MRRICLEGVRWNIGSVRKCEKQSWLLMCRKSLARTVVEYKKVQVFFFIWINTGMLLVTLKLLKAITPNNIILINCNVLHNYPIIAFFCLYSCRTSVAAASYNIRLFHNFCPMFHDFQGCILFYIYSYLTSTHVLMKMQHIPLWTRPLDKIMIQDVIALRTRNLKVK